LSEYAIFLHGLAQQWSRERNEIWHKYSLGHEDDAGTSNTRIAHKKHDTMHTRRWNHKSVCRP